MRKGWARVSCSRTKDGTGGGGAPKGGGGGDRGERGGVGWDLKGAEHGKEGLSNNSAEEQVAERGNSQSTGACLQGVDLCWVHPP